MQLLRIGRTSAAKVAFSFRATRPFQALYSKSTRRSISNVNASNADNANDSGGDWRDQASKSLSPPTMGAFDPPRSAQLLQYVFQNSCHHTSRCAKAQRELTKEIEGQTRAIMAGSPDEAQFLGWLCELISAEKVIEVGVFRGSTTLQLALCDSVKRIVCLDVSKEYTQTAQKYWKESKDGNGVCCADKIDLRIAPAIDSLNAMVAAGDGEVGTYDLAFIDADKENYDNYYERCLELVRQGGIVAVDNVLWHGRVLNDVAKGQEVTKDTAAIQALNAKLAADERVSISMLSIADGVTLCRKR